jgi:AmmeMemoRadiSam system protein A/AmmeMemoRadiSam system protein B
MSILAGYVVPHPPIIIPEIGGSERHHIERTIYAYQKIAQEIIDIKPDTLIITTPHAKAYRDVLVVSETPFIKGDFSMFRAPDVKFHLKTNTEFINRLLETGLKYNLPITGDHGQDQTLDHGTMVPLYFLKDILEDVTVVRIATSGLSISSHYQIGAMIDEAIHDDDRVVWIASGDLSHKLKTDGPYGFTKEGPQFDRQFTDLLQSNKLQDVQLLDTPTHDKAAVCGLESFAMLFGAVSKIDVSTTLLSYEGPFGVGYAVSSIKPIHVSLQVQLARQAIEQYLINHSYISNWDFIPEELTKQKAGVFVSLHKHGRLRGCIGTIAPTRPSIAEEIIHNAVSAATRDYRFSPLRTSELKELEISVDVLSSSEPIDSISELDVTRYGVIVSSGYRKGLLLPNLKGIDTPMQQVSIALQKASISPDEPYKMERFEVTRYY